MSFIPKHLKNGKTSNAVASLASVRADSYHELRSAHPKAFAIKADPDGFSGLISVNSMADFEPDGYAITPGCEIGMEEFAP